VRGNSNRDPIPSGGTAELHRLIHWQSRIFSSRRISVSHPMAHFSFAASPSRRASLLSITIPSSQRSLPSSLSSVPTLLLSSSSWSAAILARLLSSPAFAFVRRCSSFLFLFVISSSTQSKCNHIFPVVVVVNPTHPPTYPPSPARH